VAPTAVTERFRAAPRARSIAVAAGWTAPAVAAVTFYVAYDNGSYDLASRNSLAIFVWWTILVAIALGVWSFQHVSRGALTAAALLALFATWTLASTAWATSAEGVFAEFDRVALYLGVYVLAVVVASRRELLRWSHGLAAGVVVVAAVALVSRLFPGTFSGRGIASIIPNAATRLSFPLGYWNGLGIFVALAIPILLGAAVARGHVVGSVAVGSVPALAAVVFLSSSRGAVVALVAGVVVYLVAEPRRREAFAMLGLAAAGSLAAVVVVSAQHALTNGPLTSGAARSQGWRTAVVLAAICTATSALHRATARARPRMPTLSPGARIASAAALVAVLVVAVALAHPVRRFEHFKQVPTSVPVSGGTTHLLSGGGNGRWQFWGAAIDEFRSAPLQGRGAGSYETWWARHGSFSYFVVNAHSLYLQTLGDLGIVGFLLLVGAFAAAVTAAVTRLRSVRDHERTAVAGLLGAACVFLVGAGLDWMWELTAVGVVGVACLGLAGGAATLAPVPRLRPPRRRPQAAAVVAVILFAWVLVCAEAIPLLADVEVRKSQDAVRAGDGAAALKHATDATKIESWAATPYLQVALVDEAAGRLRAARHAIDAAIRRDRGDWRLWLVAARIELHQGARAYSAQTLAHARSLAPLSPVFRTG
jgi:O-Antigen ligase